MKARSRSVSKLKKKGKKEVSPHYGAPILTYYPGIRPSYARRAAVAQLLA